MTKEEARKIFLKLRRKMSCEEASQEKIKRIKEKDFLQDGMHIGLYYPILNEINLLSLISIYPKVQFYLPVTKEELLFVPFQKDTVLVSGPFHTVEPVGSGVPLPQLDAIFIPCLAIHQNRKRLGYGKGYYDRTLKAYKGLKIGVCYDALCNQQFDTEVHDLILDWII